MLSESNENLKSESPIMQASHSLMQSLEMIENDPKVDQLSNLDFFGRIMTDFAMFSNVEKSNSLPRLKKISDRLFSLLPELEQHLSHRPDVSNSITNIKSLITIKLNELSLPNANSHVQPNLLAPQNKPN